MVKIEEERIEEVMSSDESGSVESKGSSSSGIANFIAKCSKALKIWRNCPGCQASCPTKLELYRHIARCCPYAFACTKPGCPFASLHKQHFDYHMNWHNNRKDIGCQMCSYTCSTKTMLKSHMRTHQEVMRYRCADCNVSTKQPSALSQHLASSGHKAAPVLKEDGTEPEDERQADFRNHIRAKRRMREVSNVSLPMKKIKLEKENPQIVNNSEMSDASLSTSKTFPSSTDNIPIKVEPVENLIEKKEYFVDIMPRLSDDPVLDQGQINWNKWINNPNTLSEPLDLRIRRDENKVDKKHHNELMICLNLNIESLVEAEPSKTEKGNC